MRYSTTESTHFLSLCFITKGLHKCVLFYIVCLFLYKRIEQVFNIDRFDQWRCSSRERSFHIVAGCLHSDNVLCDIHIPLEKLHFLDNSVAHIHDIGQLAQSRHRQCQKHPQNQHPPLRNYLPSQLRRTHSLHRKKPLERLKKKRWSLLQKFSSCEIGFVVFLLP